MQNGKKYYFCDEVTGEIKYKLSKLLRSKVNKNQRVILHSDVDLSSHYYNVETKSIEERKSFPAGNWVGGEYVVNLPHNATLLWQGEKYTVDDGVAETNGGPAWGTRNYSFTPSLQNRDALH